MRSSVAPSAQCTSSNTRQVARSAARPLERPSDGIEQGGPGQVCRQLGGRLGRSVAETGQQLHQVEPADVGDRDRVAGIEVRPQVVQRAGDRGIWRRPRR